MSRSNLSDAELLAKYREGQREAISQLLERHTPRIRRYIHLMVRDADKAEDILQDVLIRVVRMVDEGRYRDNGRFLSWMMRIAHNMTIDTFRSSRHKMETNESNAGYDILSFQRESQPAVDDEMVREEVADQVRGLIDLLPEEQREVVKLRYFSNLSFAEIAEQTDVSINTALGRMRYALINMRKMVKDNNLALI
ncbi:MAG: sigma-70 family RNA polymerase sigma factor [Rikenellaceae bacterium]